MLINMFIKKKVSFFLKPIFLAILLFSLRHMISREAQVMEYLTEMYLLYKVKKTQNHA